MDGLTVLMQDALDHARAAGRLVYWRGGWWTTPDATVARRTVDGYDPTAAEPVAST